MKRLYLIASLSLNLVMQESQAATCDQSKEPWLNSKCEMPEAFNPNHVCRISSLLKYQKIAPDNIPLTEELIPGRPETAIESYEHLAWTTCESVKKMRCANVVEGLLKNFQNLQSVYVTDEKKPGVPLVVDVQSRPQGARDGNLIRNYDFMEAKANEILADLHGISKSMVPVAQTVKSFETLQAANRILTQKMTEIRARMDPFNISVKVFIGLKADFSKRLTIANAESIGLTDDFDCKGYSATITEYNSEVQQLVDMVNDMSFYILAVAKQNNNFFNESFYKWRYQLYKQYADATKKDINLLLSDLKTDLALDQILWDAAEWWVSATINGLAGRLHTQYYYYSEPLRILRMERLKAIDFKDKISRLTKLPPSASQDAQKTIDDMMVLIDQSINFIESRGWQGLLDLQTLSARTRAERLPNNQTCQAKTVIFLNAAGKVNSLQSFDAASPLYKETVDVCVR